jgi:hypothetical protein
MRVVLLVPRRDDDGPRDRIWAWCRQRWERYFPDIAIYEGHHDDGPFNRSAAVNTAARLADADGRWDVGIVIDSDVFLKVSQVRKAIQTAKKTGRVTWAHRRWRGFKESWTKRYLDDRHDFGPEIDREDMDIPVSDTNPISWSCCIAFPRAVWDDLGGFDERFVGWGFEDMALQSVVVGLYGHERIEGDVYHLFHPRSEERITPGQPAITATKEYTVNARLGRRYMVALRRDHGLHDRPGLPSTEEERQRDISNLIRDDEKLTVLARRHGLPDWSDWWPTLEELRDGAKRYNTEKLHGTVTVIVHTGGTPEAWPERREYLCASIASLNEKVTGPIVQRVIYDCWGDPAIREWLTETFKPMGFYVVGPSEPVDYTGSMQAMWRYLRKRAKGDYIFQVEDDFTYTQPVDLGPMIEALRQNPNLVQMALLRDAFYKDEQETGGILGWPEPAFTRREKWLEHRLFFTANPSLFPRSLTETPWPSGHHSETIFGNTVLANANARAAFWGQGDEWIKHIGAVRAGVGY